MSHWLPRDPDGYIDIDIVPETNVDLDLLSLAPVPPLPDELWTAIVHAAVHADPEAIGLDIDALASQTSPSASPEAEGHGSATGRHRDNQLDGPVEGDGNVQSDWATNSMDGLHDEDDHATEFPYDDL